MLLNLSGKSDFDLRTPAKVRTALTCFHLAIADAGAEFLAGHSSRFGVGMGSWGNDSPSDWKMLWIHRDLGMSGNTLAARCIS